MKVFWLNDGLHMTGETPEELSALGVLVRALQGANLKPTTTPGFDERETKSVSNPTPNSSRSR
jgi:hypothetical protein